jgi:hypothetical protein
LNPNQTGVSIMPLQGLVLVDSSGSEIDNHRQFVSSRGSPTKTLSQVRGEAVASAFSTLATAANLASVAWSVDQEIDRRRVEIENGIRYWSDNNPDGKCYPINSIGAVLQLIFTYPTWDAPARPLSFLALNVSDFGLDPGETLVRVVATPAIVQGAPEGTEEFWRYIWYTIA